MRRKNIRIVERKLGRERARGLAIASEKSIEIDPRQRGRAYLNTLIHETLHCVFPDWSESKVLKSASKICKVLWTQNYRKFYK